MSRRSVEVWKDRRLEVAWMVLPCQTNPTATTWPLDSRRLEQVLSSLAIFISVATLRQVGRISFARLSEIRQDRHR